MEGTLSREEYFANLKAAQDYLAHHGVKGQKWGERHYQNEDGSLTAEGYEHYYGGKSGKRLKKAEKRVAKDLKRADKDIRRFEKYGDYFSANEAKKARLATSEYVKDKEAMTADIESARKLQKGALIGMGIGAAVSVATAAAVGTGLAKMGTSGLDIADMAAEDLVTQVASLAILGGGAAGVAIANKKAGAQRKQAAIKADQVKRKYESMPMEEVDRLYSEQLAREKSA